MKTILPQFNHLVLLWAILTSMCLYAVKQVSAQVAEPAATAVVDIKPLQIGDTIPEQLWHLPLQVVSRTNQGETVTLSDYKEKLVILDFWATWCGSCISSIPKVRDLESQFKPNLKVVFVGHDKPSAISKFISGHQKGNLLRESTTADELKLYFPHVYVPHYVWLYNGRVTAITDGQELLASNINAILRGSSLAMHSKEDVMGFDRFSPFSENFEQVFSRSLISQMTLTSYVKGLGGSGATQFDGDSTLRRQNLINAPLIRIYNIAVGKPLNHFIIDASDRRLFENVTNDPYWYEQHTYCFEMITPATMPDEARKKQLIAELNAKLGLRCRLEEREVEAYELVVSGKTEANAITDNNGVRSAQQVVDAFNFFAKYENNRSIYNPILINGCPSNIQIPTPPRTALDGIGALNSFLAPFDLKAVAVREKIDVFVLSD